MEKSKVEALICDREFSYLQPYFYNNPYALRCELGVGEGVQYHKNAKERALKIYNILFPHGADANFFDYYVCDYSTSGEAEEKAYDDDVFNYEEYTESYINFEVRQLRFLYRYQGKYRHNVVRDLKTYEKQGSEYAERERRNRIICYSDGKGFDYDSLIDLQIAEKGYDISFVSFDNECIYSIYDDRGADAVFVTREKMRRFYPILKPYLFDYDAEEMEKRYLG